jgi:putative ABC transport system ATP-binding protein
VTIDGREIGGLGDKALTQLRRDRLGFVFQSFNLVPVLTAEENIRLPLTLAGRDPDKEWLDGLIDSVGLSDRLSHRPAELSGGQQQRVAIARALVHRPAVVFADEPTGNLDTHSSEEVLELLRRAVADLGQTVVMVTHDPGAAAHSDLVLFLGDGRIVDEMARPTAEGVLERMKRFDSVRAAFDGEGGSGAAPGATGTKASGRSGEAPPGAGDVPPGGGSDDVTLDKD